MVSSFSSRPISSVRGLQPPSPHLSGANNTPDSRSNSSLVDSSPRIRSSSERSGLASSSEARHSSPPTAASTRSSEHSFDRVSASSLGKRSITTSATLPISYDVDPLPSIKTLDLPKGEHLSAHPAWTPRQTATMNPAEKADLTARRASSPPASAPVPPSLRRPTSPAGRISNHSAEYDLHSDRGSPRLAARRPGPPLPAASTGAPAAPPTYAREYGSSPRAAYPEAPYRDPRELSPPTGSSGLKRKLSIPSEMGSRRAMPERIDRGRDPWALGPAEYASRSANYAATTAEQDYYRGGRGRGDTPERKYPSPYSRDPAYAGRYPDPRMDDPRYSPRHAYPTSPSSSRTAYRAAPHDPTVPPYPRRSDRYSPVPSSRSPSYAHRSAHPSSQAPPPPHDPYARAAPHSSYLRRPSPPPYAADSRPVLPPLSSRNPASRYPSAAPAPAATSRGSRYTPPSEAVPHPDRLSPSPEPHAYSEPFYPDRRLFFARERIQDPEMDEYYHGPAGSAGAPVGKPRYPDPYYDPYGSPHAGAYPPPGAHGKPTNGMAGPGPVAPYARPPHDPRMPYPGPYGHGDYMPHDPRDMHPHAGMPRMARPAGVMPVPAAHVPPGPSAGIAPPPRRRGKLPKPVTDLLKTWLLEHASHPYPTEDEKRSLCSMTGLTLSQVSNWFINARRRILLPTGANGSPGGTTAAQVKAAFRDDSVSPEP
ncbi:Homeobox KN domain protein [Kalmanozyma brasiliensis GHG001]|uniref:Homeobox KN domain protein n=1 Tax=Kalmanozyma brasiliensis (strain GHG001) TaxID=1365824 RepID=UPI002867BBD6|nr:Homeobox KN domain protein [Kalmanozyma brasiliensis GHG001]EST06425.2 Homeobox KN domain protein [Kalmanozyma brasiliensis GHG001]